MADCSSVHDLHLFISVGASELSCPGGVSSVSGRCDLAEYVVGDRVFSIPCGVAYDVTVTNSGDGILVTGTVSAQVLGTCDRCLQVAKFDISSEIEQYFLFKPLEASEYSNNEDSVDFSFVSHDETIDIFPALMSALITETPYVVVCDVNCKGLCRTCGANLNYESCDCEHQQEMPASDGQNPFAALKDFKPLKRTDQ